jgi:hypothetical protein
MDQTQVQVVGVAVEGEGKYQRRWLLVVLPHFAREVTLFKKMLNCLRWTASSAAIIQL